MTGPVLAAILFAAAGQTAPAALPIFDRYAQVTVRERVIIRVPRLPEAAAPAARKRGVAPKRLNWDEKKAPRCLAVKSLAGAAITQPNSVDLVLRGGARLRAKLERSCPALDFYSGFYLKPARDGQICADRDTIHDRSGGQCEITAFRTLVPKR